MITNSVTVRPHGVTRTDSSPQVDTLAPLTVSAKRIPELDRHWGMAILLVLIYHFAHEARYTSCQKWLFCLLDNCLVSWSGLGLIFVLSDFVIGGILLEVRKTPNRSRAFYARRFFRILHLFAVVVGVPQIRVAPHFFEGVNP